MGRHHTQQTDALPVGLLGYGVVCWLDLRPGRLGYRGTLSPHRDGF